MGRRDRVSGLAVARAAAMLPVVLLLSGCGLVGGPRVLHPDEPQEITVTSPAFSQGVIPRRYICHGAQSPPIFWSGAPPGTKSIALVLDDSDAPITPYVYWIVFDISPATSDFQPGQLPPGARQADNSHGQARFDPPCPLTGSHKYRFTVYALDAVLSQGSGAELKSTWQAIARHAIARGRLTATARA